MSDKHDKKQEERQTTGHGGLHTQNPDRKEEAIDPDKDSYIPWPKQNVKDATQLVMDCGWEAGETRKTVSQDDLED